MNSLESQVRIQPVALGSKPSTVCMPRGDLDQRFSENKRGDVAQMEYAVSLKKADACGAKEQEVRTCLQRSPV